MEKYLITCGHCYHRVFTDGKDLQGLTEVAYAQPPARANGVDHSTVNLGKRFRCPQCGYLMKARMVPAQPVAEVPQQDRPMDMDEIIAKRREAKVSAPAFLKDFICGIDDLVK